ncbi:MAG: primosomal protein N' [Deltaproteobacteria bacterium]|nr:primosomal protein N' [Deltaproteobacteria bacterium]
MSGSSSAYVEVAVDVPLEKTFTYHVPEAFHGLVEPGQRVLVPFGRRRLTGYVLGSTEPGALREIRDLADVLDPAPLVPPGLLELYRWAASYYFAPISEFLRSGLPHGINLESVRTVRLTEAGRRARHGAPAARGTEGTASAPDGREARVLQAIPEHGAVPLAGLVRRLRGQPVHHLVRLLEREGLVEVTEDLSGLRVRPKYGKVVRLAEPGEGSGEGAHGAPGDGGARAPKLTPKQQVVVSYLQVHGEVPLAALRDQFGEVGPLVQRLAAKGVVTVAREEVLRQPLGGQPPRTDRPELTPEQEAALAALTGGIQEGRFVTYLLHGITGSGKTEIYLQAIEAALVRGRRAIVLVPEIALTPQLVAWFEGRFGRQIALWHSRLSDGERFDEWRRLQRGEARILLGARSAVLVPLADVGVIVVDEEHDPSYKQEERPRYHARDLAVVRGRCQSAVVILGSATPALESYHNARQGKFVYLQLPLRVEERPLPAVEVLDLRAGPSESRRWVVLSERLKAAIQEALDRGEQTLLFLKRRGFATFVQCLACGEPFKCPRCSVTLTFHERERRLACHYCGHGAPGPSICPRCGDFNVMMAGLGTERLEGEVRSLFPDASVGRMDRDTTSGKAAAQEILSRLASGELEVLVGTQMITKGHDYPTVTLVGVVCADLALNFPDFRATERAFQLLTQVAGRAGRGDRPGRVIVQTFNPEHYSIQHASRHDYEGFAREELALRQAFLYPPFCRLVNLRLAGKRLEQVKAGASQLAAQARGLQEQRAEWRRDLEILGPAVCPLARLRGKHRWQLLVKGRQVSSLHAFIRGLLETLPREVRRSGLTLAVDVDPVNLM